MRKPISSTEPLFFFSTYLSRVFKNFICLISLFAFCKVSNAQSEIPALLTPSPNASSLGIHGPMDLNYYNGLPQIGIPLFNFTNNELSSQISLSYSPGGVKVNQIASWVGMGWNLNVGGVITRVVRGLPDEVGYGYTDYINNPVPASFTFQQGVSFGNIDKFVEYALGVKDSEPDEFYFSFGGYSGKFFFDQQKNFFPIPFQNLKFESSGLANFTITDEKGIKYFFSTKEYSQNSSVCESGCGNIGSSYVSAWYLTSITTPLNKVISFEYEDYEPNKYVVSRHETKYYPSKSGDGVQTAYTKIYEGKRISRIVHDQGTIEFIAGLNRCDLIGDKSLKYILIKNNENVLIKKIQFDYLYLSGTLGETWRTEAESCATELNSRLYLHKVTEIGTKDSSEKTNPYTFTYNPGLPSRLSIAQDHWGFYNTNTINTLIPSTDFTYNGDAVFHEGAYREPDLSRTACGSLTKIEFPTGESQSFEYELNDVTSSTVGLSPNFSIETTSMSSILHDVNPLTFTISSGEALNINLSGSGYNGSNPSSWPIRFTIKNSSSVSVYSSLSFANLGVHRISGLANGTYSLFFDVHNSSIPLGSTSGNYYAINIKRKVNASTANGIKVGGLRIKKIITNNPTAGGGQSAKQYVRAFEYKDGNGMSSGRIVFCPDYYPSPYSEGTGGEGGFMWSYVKLSSSPNYILENTVSSTVGYMKVTEYHSNYNPYDEFGQNGKTEYYFTSTEQYPDDILNIVQPETSSSNYYHSQVIRFPFSPPTSMEWKRGKLLQQIDYKWVASNTYSVVKKTENEYNYTTVGQIRPLRVAVTGLITNYDPYSTRFWFNYYTIGTGYVTLKNTKTTEYVSPLLVQRRIDYTYNAQLLPTSITETGTYGIKQIMLKYPLDYASIQPYNKMLALHMIAPVIDRTHSQGSYSKSEKSKFNYWKNSNWGDTSSAMILLQHVETQTLLNSPEVRLRYHSYDDDGNIITVSKENDIKQTYIWGHKKSFAIAEVTNADASQIAFTSFEDDASGNWAIGSAIRNHTDVLTGTKSFDLANGNISKAGLINGNKYVLSFWSKSGTKSIHATITEGGIRGTVDGWSKYEYVVTANSAAITISGSGLIDELRLYPVDAQMKSFTFLPLVGLTSQCGVDNQITYYEYDNFQRLSLVRDEGKNILKRICYNYTGQAEACKVYSNQVMSQPFVRSNCGPGFTAGSYTYIVPAGKYLGDTQAVADSIALADITANGQRWADSLGTCTALPLFYNTYQSQNFTRNNCEVGFTGGTYLYEVAANTCSTYVSQAAANQLAQDRIGLYGQAAANTYGTCTVSAPLVYARFELDFEFVDQYWIPGPSGGVEYFYSEGLWMLRFYSDAACTLPYTLTDTVKFSATNYYVSHTAAGTLLSDGDVSYGAHTVAPGVNAYFVALAPVFSLDISYMPGYPDGISSQSLESNTMRLTNIEGFVLRPYSVGQASLNPKYYFNNNL